MASHSCPHSSFTGSDAQSPVLTSMGVRHTHSAQANTNKNKIQLLKSIWNLISAAQPGCSITYLPAAVEQYFCAHALHVWPISEPLYLDCVPLWYQFLILIVDSTRENREKYCYLHCKIHQSVVGSEGLSLISTDNVRHTLLLWEARSHVKQSPCEAATEISSLGGHWGWIPPSLNTWLKHWRFQKISPVLWKSAFHCWDTVPSYT